MKLNDVTLKLPLSQRCAAAAEWNAQPALPAASKKRSPRRLRERQRRYCRQYQLKAAYQSIVDSSRQRIPRQSQPLAPPPDALRSALQGR